MLTFWGSVQGNGSLQKVGVHVVDPSFENKQSSVLIGLCCCFIVVQMFVRRRKSFDQKLDTINTINSTRNNFNPLLKDICNKLFLAQSYSSENTIYVQLLQKNKKVMIITMEGIILNKNNTYHLLMSFITNIIHYFLICELDLYTST